MERTKRVIVVAALALVLGTAATAWAIRSGAAESWAELSDEAREFAARVLWKSVAFALAVLLVAWMVPVAVPAWLALGAAGATFIATGGYEIVQSVAPVLPRLSGRGSGGGGGGGGGATLPGPDPCEVGPYQDAAGVWHLCSQ